MMIRKCSYRNRLLHRELDSSVDVCVQNGSTPGSITKEMVNCGEISWGKRSLEGLRNGGKTGT